MNEDLLESISKFKRELENAEHFDETSTIVGDTISEVEQIIYNDDYREDGGVGKSILLSLVMFQHLVKQLDQISEDIQELDNRTND